MWSADDVITFDGSVVVIDWTADEVAPGTFDGVDWGLTVDESGNNSLALHILPLQQPPSRIKLSCRFPKIVPMGWWLWNWWQSCRYFNVIFRNIKSFKILAVTIICTCTFKLYRKKYVFSFLYYNEVYWKCYFARNIRLYNALLYLLYLYDRYIRFTIYLCQICIFCVGVR